jgi:hypothetical protein
MIARNLETRIVKLEGSRRRADEIFVIWREAGGEVASAIAAADLAVGHEAICAEWFGDSPPPAPRWYRRPRFDMDPVAYEYINLSIERIVDADRPHGFAPFPLVANYRLAELTDNDLLHIALGVE